jgi:Xaa-Pro dipeptidase|tara:strand:+ start:138 stop:1235 length:1098 start_codon:yes stop_codon:yes gene_type:complete
MTDFRTRRQRAAEIVRKAGLSAIALVPGPNFRYLTGLDFHLMERPTLLFLFADGEVSSIMPELERTKWREAFPDAETHFWQDSDSYDDAFRSCSETLNGAVGVEGMRMRMFEYQALAQNMPQGAVRDAESALAELRMCKDPEEIANLRRAIAISEAALGDLIDTAKAGESEAKLAARLKQAMLSHGAESFAFDPIVLSGPNSADPHGTPGETETSPGEPLLIDFGASFGAMNADITRTFFCQHVGEEFRAIYETVLAANAKGKATAAPGVTCDTLDRETTNVLTASPFSEMIVHKTGHGLGLDVHEAPQVMIGNTTELKPGVVITIEPGLYRPSEIGVRIEDDVLITDTGAESLTAFSREVTCFG